jgi:hypothetical protein
MSCKFKNGSHWSVTSLGLYFFDISTRVLQLQQKVTEPQHPSLLDTLPGSGMPRMVEHPGRSAGRCRPASTAGHFPHCRKLEGARTK